MLNWNYDFIMLETKLWEKQEYETDTAYDRFLNYYLLPQTLPRSVDKAYRFYHETVTKTSRKFADRNWKNWAWPRDSENLKLPSWGQRAAAYDAHNNALRIERWQAEYMSADETKARLSQHARSNISLFTDIKTAEDLKNHPSAYLVKKAKIRTFINSAGREVTDIDLELYDAQSALEKIGKTHKIFTDNPGSTTSQRGSAQQQADEDVSAEIQRMSKALDD